MIGKLRTLGFCALALVAVSALAASSAQATAAKFMSEAAGTTAISASQTTQHVFTIETGTGTALTVKCPTATFTSASTGEPSELTVTATYGSEAEMCTAFGLSAEVNMNGCDYILAAGTNTAADKYEGTATVQCPEGKKIIVRTTNNVCKVEVGAQGPLFSVIYRDETGTSPKTIEIEPNIVGITYTEVTDGVGCPLTMVSKTLADGKYTGNTTAKGTSGGVGTGITLTP